MPHYTTYIVGTAGQEIVGCLGKVVNIKNLGTEDLLIGTKVAATASKNDYITLEVGENITYKDCDDDTIDVYAGANTSIEVTMMSGGDIDRA